MVSAQVLGGHIDRVVYEVGTLAAPGPVARRMEAAGIPVHSLGSGDWIAQLRRLMRLVRTRRFDVVNAYGFKATMLARAAVHQPLDGRLRPMLVCGVRGLRTTEVEDMRSGKARVVAIVERLTKGMVDVWDANSPGAAAFIQGLGVPADRIRCIPNGLDLRAWPEAASATVHDPPVILCVSRFVARKRHADLVAALARLREAGVDFRADLVGDGPEKPAIQQLVSSMALEDRVRFHATLAHPEIHALMQRSSLFCLPSAWEGMPGAVMEAMAAGLPVVATDVNGTDMLVIDGVTGRLVPPRAPMLLAQALNDCLANPQLMSEMGKAGRRRIEEEFSLEKMIERKENLYAEVVRLSR
jgi:glycosyltransferase involved in cell wall biosynthesis